MDFALIQERAKKISYSLGLESSEVGDVLSELWLMATELPRFHKLSDKEARAVVAKRMGLHARFVEIGESLSKTDEQGEEMPSLLEVQSDGMTAEKLMAEAENPDLKTDEQLDVAQATASIDLNRAFAQMSAQEEDLFFMHDILKLKYSEMAILCAKTDRALPRYVQRERTLETMRVFEDCASIQMEGYFS
ncbi:MAG: hypothetical protein HC838_00155 [Spirulinaceae cyanobacterium RM2_2_10]|nr:hypothetical protein [Spirulinaceae cyanobacterium RM2_2_10]